MPICSVHNAPMREGKYPGSFFCTKFVGIGAQGANEKGYCDQKVKAAPAPRAPQASFATPAAVTSQPVGDPLAVSALHFAGHIFQGSGKADDALEVAQKAYRFLKGAA